MTFPPPHPAAQNSITSGTTKSSGVRQLRSQQSAWGLPPPGTSARRGLTPLATDLGSSSVESSNRPAATAASPSPFTSTFSSILSSSSGRGNINRVTSSASPSSSYPPLQSGSQANPSLLSPRSRAITPSSISHPPSSAAASSTASQIGGGNSSGGGGGSRSQTFSPSLPQQNLSSPTSNTFDRSTGQGLASSVSNLTGSSSVSKIVVTQVFILLGSITEKEGRAKWESQAEAIRKVRPAEIPSDL